MSELLNTHKPDENQITEKFPPQALALPLDWLLQGPAWVRWRTRLDFTDSPSNDPSVIADHAEMLADPRLQTLLSSLSELHREPIKNHKKANHPLHTLVFLADLGLNTDIPEIAAVVENILSEQSPEGVFNVLVDVPKAFGGDGKEHAAWFLCDAPLLVYVLQRFGYANDSRVEKALSFLANTVRDNGFPCAVSPVLGKFRGPGKASDPCPYANLLMLRALSQSPTMHDSEAAHQAAYTLLDLWENSLERRPFLFRMGTDFRKLKAPLIWYDILHVLDVLSQFSWLHSDPRLQEIVSIVKNKADQEGRFTPESVWMAWKGWDFGQKKTPSYGLTYLVQRALQRFS